MDCKKVQHLMERYLDSELSLSDKRTLEDHLDQCPDCSRSLDALKLIGMAIKQKGRVKAPAMLKRKIRLQLKDITAEEGRMDRLLPWLGFSGGVLVFVSVLTWAMFSFILATPNNTTLTEEIISAHVRSLMVDHATDITSSNTHTVKPWFKGRLDFAPPVRNYAARGFPLLGGRLDYLQHRPVSALIYRRRAHTINVFIWPSYDSGETTARTERRQGYNIIHWSTGGLHYWMISDLNMKELNVLAGLFQEKKVHRPG